MRMHRAIAIATGLVLATATVAAATSTRSYGWQNGTQLLQVSLSGQRPRVYVGGRLHGTAIICKGSAGGAGFRLGFNGAAIPGAKATFHGGVLTASYNEVMPGFTQKFGLAGHLEGNAIKGSFSETKTYDEPPSVGACRSGTVDFVARRTSAPAATGRLRG
jgi:hypothetical protein